MPCRASLRPGHSSDVIQQLGLFGGSGGSEADTEAARHGAVSLKEALMRGVQTRAEDALANARRALEHKLPSCPEATSASKNSGRGRGLGRGRGRGRGSTGEEGDEEDEEKKYFEAEREAADLIASVRDAVEEVHARLPMVSAPYE